MTAATLFPPTPRERLAVVAKFVSEERLYRVHMLQKYGSDQSQHIYWQKRVTQCDESLAHLNALAEAVRP